MSSATKIEWADSTFNPWIGCAKVSPGCKHCYAEQTTRARVLRGQGRETWGKGAKRARTSEANWKQPLKWNKIAGRDLICNLCGGFVSPVLGYCSSCASDKYKNDLSPKHDQPLFGIQKSRPRIFPSLCDWLDDEVPVEWLADFLKLLHDTPNLEWLLLTKRPENFFERIQSALWKVEGLSTEDQGDSEDLPRTETGHMLNDWIGGKPPGNVWLGTSVEDQPNADQRIPELLKIPAKVRFLSCEPLLGPIRFKDALRCDVPIHWVIFGGESGSGARPCNVDWIRDGVKQCQAAGVAAFVRQLGANVEACDIIDAADHFPGLVKLAEAARPNARILLKNKKGGDMAEWPVDLRVREMPRL